jgi:hypothetical protein
MVSRRTGKKDKENEVWNTIHLKTYTCKNSMGEKR